MRAWLVAALVTLALACGDSGGSATESGAGGDSAGSSAGSGGTNGGEGGASSTRMQDGGLDAANG